MYCLYVCHLLYAYSDTFTGGAQRCLQMNHDLVKVSQHSLHILNRSSGFAIAVDLLLTQLGAQKALMLVL